MTEIDTSREAVESLVSLLRHNSAWENMQEIDIIAHAEAIAILPALLARAEKAEAERDEAWNAAIEAAADRIHQHIQKVQPEMTRRAQRLAENKKPDFNYAIHRTDLDARMSCRDQVRALKRGSTND